MLVLHHSDTAPGHVVLLLGTNTFPPPTKRARVPELDDPDVLALMDDIVRHAGRVGVTVVEQGAAAHKWLGCRNASDAFRDGSHFSVAGTHRRLLRDANCMHSLQARMLGGGVPFRVLHAEHDGAETTAQHVTQYLVLQPSIALPARAALAGVAACTTDMICTMLRCRATAVAAPWPSRAVPARPPCPDSGAFKRCMHAYSLAQHMVPGEPFVDDVIRAGLPVILRNTGVAQWRACNWTLDTLEHVLDGQGMLARVKLGAALAFDPDRSAVLARRGHVDLHTPW